MKTAKNHEANAKRADERAARLEHRRIARGKLVSLRAKLKEAIATRRVRMRELVAELRAKRLTIRAQIKAMRDRDRQAITDRAKAERAAVHAACVAQKKQAKETSDSAIAYARAEFAAERRRAKEEKRITRTERASHAAVDRAQATGADLHTIRHAMLGMYGPLFHVVRPTAVRAGESHAEAVLRHAETRPEEAHAIVHHAADRAIAETKAEIAALERSLNAPSTADLARAHTSRRKRARVSESRPSGVRLTKRASAPKAKVAEPRRKKGQLPKNEGMALADLIRERDELAAERAARKAKKEPKRAALTGESLRAAPANEITVAATGMAERERLRARAAEPEKKVKAPELRDTSEIAKRIRKDILRTVQAGVLPKARYSVRTEKYSMGSTIHVEASKLPFPVINPEAYVVHNGDSHVMFDSAHFRSRFTAKAQAAEKTLNAIVDAYHWDRSDPQTDYYNERFHKDVRLTEDRVAFNAMEAEKVAVARAARSRA